MPADRAEACLHFLFANSASCQPARALSAPPTPRGGIEPLYSDSFFTREEFARAYRIDRYDVLKARVDPEHRLLGLYEKCVLRA